MFVALAIVWAVIGVPTEDASADGHLPIVYLTFDDGPSFDDVTASLLDVLAAYDVKATFFPIGNWLPRDPVTSQRLADEGHAIGNHSTTHPRLNLLTREEVISELQGGQNLINAYTGVTPTCYRPPYGATSDEVRDAAASLGLIEWMWTLSTNDFDPASTTASILAALERSVNPRRRHDDGRRGELVQHRGRAPPAGLAGG